MKKMDRGNSNNNITADLVRILFRYLEREDKAALGLAKMVCDLCS